MNPKTRNQRYDFLVGAFARHRRMPKDTGAPDRALQEARRSILRKLSPRMRVVHALRVKPGQEFSLPE
jgi:hypothetical protein